MGGNTNQDIQRGIGGAQIAGGAVATAMGAPEIGVPMMMGGIKGEVNPNPNQGPMTSGISGALSAGGALAGGMGGDPTSAGLGSDPLAGAVGTSGSLGGMTGDVTGGATQGGLGGLGGLSGGMPSGFNPQMLSQLMEPMD